MDEVSRRRRYKNRLKLPTGEVAGPRKAALDRAHDLRRFEIENYWRRATYFWGFQLVAFGAVALSAKDGRVFPELILPVSVLGAVTAFAGVLTAKGSKFWQQNWEGHVDLLEDEVEGRLHQTALVRDRLERSVSKVNERLLALLAAGWVAIFLAAAAARICPGLLKLPDRTAALLQIGITAVALIIGIGWLWLSPKSDLADRAFNYGDMSPYGKGRSNAGDDA